MIEFNAADHTYRDAEGEIPSVSAILKCAGYVRDYPNSSGADRGTKIHQLTEDFDMGITEIRYPELEDYLEGYRMFRAQNPCIWKYCEEIVFDPIKRFAGTLDRAGKLNDLDIILDIKSGSREKWHALQLAAYKTALNNVDFRDWKKYCLYLKPNGYDLVEHTAESAEIAFNAAVVTYYGLGTYGPGRGVRAWAR